MNFPYNYNYNFPATSSTSMVGNYSAKEKKKGAKRNSGGAKTRLSTDPQSVAARERRHRISDRFKILRSMVPGGTKMDTVSMLDEAIHYVKFLKTQIWLHETMINFVDDDPAAAAGLFFPSSATSDILGSQHILDSQHMSGYTTDYENLVPASPLVPHFQDFGFYSDEVK